ncbi:hypothetical protein evm_012444 [Chilo suppressalis]|nr:hypothetical protein evm_012444 [Chilo suppressalis]
MVSDHRRPWTLATPGVSQMRCRPLRKKYALFLKVFGSYWSGDTAGDNIFHSFVVRGRLSQPGLTPVHLDPVHLNPLLKSWDILLQKSCNVAGVLMKVCDPDAPPMPNVELVSLTQANIKRHGFPINSATVETTVYCEPSNLQLNYI